MEMSATDYENSLAHYGILRKSGRYPWGSGKNPLQRSKTFLDILEQHKKEGLSYAEIAALYDDKENGFPFTSTDLRALKSRAVTERTQDQIRQAQALKDKGMGFSEIARRMSTPEKTYNESSIRSLLEPGRLDRLDTLQKTAEMLKRQVAEKGMIDVGLHVERDIPIGDSPEVRVGISKDKFNTALSMLKEEGYAVATYKSPQVGTGENTTYRVLLKPPRKGMTQREIDKYAWANRDNLQLISEKTKNGGKDWDEVSFKPPLSISPRRIGIRYKEDGGADADGVIYVRPGVKDIELGKSHYAQVRIAVGGTHFLKGMAVYKNDLPPGVDLVFNTSKEKTANKLDAMKPMRTDKDGNVDQTNPFGAFPKLIGGQILGKDGKPTSAMNILREQGDWDTWSRTLSSQFLAKQSPDVAKSQLDLTYDRKAQEFAEIKALTNPVIKRKLLESFSDEVDSSGVHLKAANMPRQATKVIMPVSSMKPTEVYAPTFDNGERISLVRFPHAGTFEIPELTVNNRNPEAKRLFSQGRKVQAPDAIGIHPKVAEHLSGADFDGDTVVAVPNKKGVVRSRSPLQGLKDFDPREAYKPYPGMKTIDGGKYDPNHPDKVDYGKDANGNPRKPKIGNKGNEMGKVTNLISDMTIKGANDDEVAAAVRHSMVVIDAEKHHLDYKASERQNKILALKRRYQGGVSEKGNPTTGASTLLTRATARKDVPKRKQAPSDHPGSGKGVVRTPIGTVDRKTGEKVYVPTGDTDSRGKDRTFRSRRMAETTDARTLLSDHGGQPIERIYATHSNKLKKLANEARLELIRTEPMRKNSSAASVYRNEVSALNSKLNIALQNAPRERRAQAVANEIVAQRRRANPDMDAAEKKKIKGQALNDARERTGAKKDRIVITDREWEAIQAGAISTHKLKDILNNTDMDKLKERATPRKNPVMTTVMQRRAEQMRNSGATYAEIAEALGIPQSTLQSSLGGG